MAHDGVTANLLMLAVVAAGRLSVNGIVFEMWPTLPFNQVEVSMAYPGATPDEIEEQVGALDNVKSVNSVAAFGIASARRGAAAA